MLYLRFEPRNNASYWNVLQAGDKRVTLGKIVRVDGQFRFLPMGHLLSREDLEAVAGWILNQEAAEQLVRVRNFYTGGPLCPEDEIERLRRLRG